MTIGKKIKLAREQRGWNKRRLTIETGIEVCIITRIEHTDRPVLMSELNKIAAALKRPVKFFLSEDEPPKEHFLHCNDRCSTCRQDETTCKDA